MATITKNIPAPDELNLAPNGPRKRILKVSTAELNGILDILANPKPPTPELQAAWAEYKAYVADNPDSNW